MVSHKTERYVVEQFLAEPRWSRGALKAKLHSLDPRAVDLALIRLLAKGVVAQVGDDVHWRLVPCARHARHV